MQNKQPILTEKTFSLSPRDRKKVLFANFPADGHFNPLTSLARHLQLAGHDVRWYSSSGYKKKIGKLGIPYYPYQRAVDVKDNDFDQAFPERKRYKTQVGKLKYDIINAFIKRGPEYYADIVDIYREFRFDIMVADVAFTGIPFVKELMKIPVIAIGVLPLTETSRDLPPAGLGMEPSASFFGKMRQGLLRAITDRLIFAKPNKVMYGIFDEYGIPHNRESVFDMMIIKSSLLLQSGTPGFEYQRSDLSGNIRFIGPLLPHHSASAALPWFDERLKEFKKVVLVTQGTVEKDIEKILVPTLEAFRGTDILVVATTGGSGTERLRSLYPDRNFIIEDFIPFNDVMPHADVYITNGGYGGVMLGIENKLPMLVAGVNEGKNEICARVSYFKLGINLRTEKPKAAQIGSSVEQILGNSLYKKNVVALGREFARYDSCRLFERYVDELLYPGTAKIRSAIKQISSN